MSMLPDRKRFESGSHAQEVTLSRWLWNLPGRCDEGGEKVKRADQAWGKVGQMCGRVTHGDRFSGMAGEGDVRGRGQQGTG